MNPKSRAMRLKARCLKPVRIILHSPIYSLILLHYGTAMLGENSISAFNSGGNFTLKSQPCGYSQKQNSYLEKKILRTHCEIWVKNTEKYSSLSPFKSDFLIFLNYSGLWLMKNILNKKRIMLNCSSVAMQFKVKSVFIIVFPCLYSNIWKCMQIYIPLFCG